MNIIVTLFCAFISLAQCGHPNDKCWKQCDFVDYVAVVKCPATSDIPDQACTCMQSHQEDDAEDTDCLGSITKQEGTQSWLECHNLANANANGVLQNTFFRWELKGDMTHCYFLSKCDPLPGECVPFPEASCVAGPSTEACQDEPTPTCAAGTWDDEGFHWSCRSGSEPFNIYTSTDEKIPAAITCETEKTECQTWTWEDESEDHLSPKIATAICDSDSGDWVSVPLLNQLMGINVNEAGEDETVKILPNVKDVVCRCETLTIADTVFNTPGLSLLCDQLYNPADGGITYGNSCTLLCDGHFVMYIECYKGQWMDTSQYPFEVVNSDEIKC